MKVNEIFHSIQGEGMNTGFPTVFIRFTGCNLRCSYCDTQYAYSEGVEMEIGEIIEKVEFYSCKRVCLTGGEPLLQAQIQELLDQLQRYQVSIETNGSIDISRFAMLQHHTLTMDMKTPCSGESEKMHLENMGRLREQDEIKFVIGSKSDYEWAKEIIKRCYTKGIITFSPVFGTVEPKDMIGWILQDRLDVRFQLQLHKLVWDADKRGV